MPLKAQSIAIVGTGLIGSSWAAFFAAHGFEVRCFDRDKSARAQGLADATRAVRQLAELNLLADALVDRAIESLAVTDDLHEAVADVGLIQESVAERYEIKKDVFGQIDRLASPETLLASSSSGLLISELQSVMQYPERSLIAHPFNPPHLMPLVELVPGTRTSEQTVKTAQAFYSRLGKVPIVLRKEIPGHVANRLQAALWREAVDLVLSGVASVEDVDRAVVAGPGIRWAIFGPHLLFHLGGGSGGIRHFMDHVGAAWTDLWSDMADWKSLPPEAADKLESGVLSESGDRTTAQLAAWRDGMLAAIQRLVDGESTIPDESSGSAGETGNG